MKALLAAVAVTVLSSSVAGSSPDVPNVSIKATSASAVAIGQRAYVRVVIRIKPHPDNRNLVFMWESPDGESGRNDRQLEGEDSQTIFDTSDKRFFGRLGFQLPAGHYTLLAIVERAPGDDPRATTEITILGGSHEDR